MKNLGKLFLAIILIIVGVSVSLLAANIVFSISHMFEIPYLKTFTVLQLLGLSTVISIFTFKYRNEKSESKEFSESLYKSFINSFGRCIIYLLTWGVSYLAFLILK